MWDCAVNLIAAIHGSCEKLSSFNMHLFTPSSLDGSYIPGSTVEFIVVINSCIINYYYFIIDKRKGGSRCENV